MTLAAAILWMAVVWVSPASNPVYAPAFRNHPQGAAAYAEDLEHMFRDAGASHGVDPLLLAALARYESGFDHSRVSRVHAFGVMQLLPSSRWGRAYVAQCRELICQGQHQTWFNIWYGAQAVAEYRTWCGSEAKALGAYRSGRCIVGPQARKVLRLRTWLRAAVST